PHEPGPWRRDPARVHRHGHRHQARGSAQDFRAVLHDQAPGTRHRPGSFHLLRYHRRAPGADRRRIAGRRRLELQGISPHRLKILVVEDDKTVGQYAVDFKVQALKMGADDYVTKPFSLEELLARVEALGRRPKAIAPPVLRVADLTLDTGSREVRRGGRLIELTPKEYAVLEYL